MTKVKIEIKNRWTGDILFEYEKENNTIKDTLEEAIKSNADLSRANLRGADLRGADLSRANLRGADLRGADLRDADLGGASLQGAYFRDANLIDANLGGADLRWAKLREANLVGANLRDADLGGASLQGASLEGSFLRDWGKLKDIFIVGCIGSRRNYTTIYKTDKGIFVQCGCFKGSVDKFVDVVKETHKGNTHERDYLAMIEFAKIKFQEE